MNIKLEVVVGTIIVIAGLFQLNGNLLGVVLIYIGFALAK